MHRHDDSTGFRLKRIGNGGELGKGETGPCGRKEAGEEGSRTWDVPPELGGGEVELQRTN